MQTTIKNIIIDPGHGGLKDGVYQTKGKQFIFPTGEIAYEGEINRNISMVLGDILANLGYNILYTVNPNDPEDISLDKRVRFANQFGKDESIYISIHNNASPTPGKARGFEIYTSPGKTRSDDLADNIYRHVKLLYDKLNIPMRYDLSDGDWDKEERFYVLMHTKMPAVLLEVLFFDNYDDYKLLKDSQFIRRVSEYIIAGIQSYINK